MKIDVFTVGALMVNCIIISNESECIIFDPGDNSDKISSFLDKNHIKPLAIINTHGHFDHIGGIDNLKKIYGINLIMSKKDEFLLKQASSQSYLLGLPSVETTSIDKDIVDGDIIKLCDLTIIAIHTPGHTPGSFCYYIKELNLLISGDTLFKGSVGRTDAISNHIEMIETIKNKLLILPDDCTIIAGHGGKTTIGLEKHTNMFLN